jgi:hypothetical protein
VVERSEYFARQEILRALALEQGYAGVVAWSRGGGGQDRYADVYYLTGFYTHQPSSRTWRPRRDPAANGDGARPVTWPW